MFFLYKKRERKKQGDGIHQFTSHHRGTANESTNVGLARQHPKNGAFLRSSSV
jgi:hypothetical protein